MTDASDKELLLEVQKGRAEAFAILFERYARTVYNYCFRRTSDWDAAEDLTSAVFLEAWRRRDTELLRGSALPWLLGVATNLLRNRRRSLRRYRAALNRVPPPQPYPDHAEDLASRLDDERQMRSTLQALSHLSLADQEVLTLVVWTGLSYKEAAEALGLPVGTVRSRLSRARVRLRELVELNGHVLGESVVSVAREGGEEKP
ncbi:MAG: RNA polymerase sigma factor [Actinomycetota bacterium]